MLELAHVTRRFGAKTAVGDISLRIASGQMVGVIGKSGAGKSTLLRMINRLVDPSEGSIAFHDLDVTGVRGASLRAWRSDCAMIFQQFNLVPRLDVLTNVLLGRLNSRSTLKSLFSIFTHEERLEAIATLDRLDIASVALQRAGTLSGGQQQRVAIARALMQRPKVILADEPIASLDPESSRRVMDMLRALNVEHQLTVLVSLHQVDIAMQYCPRTIALRRGKVVYDGPSDALTPVLLKKLYGDDARELLDEAAHHTAAGAPAQDEVTPAATRYPFALKPAHSN
jgi:phosphonate transport system ATP-binding protein